MSSPYLLQPSIVVPVPACPQNELQGQQLSLLYQSRQIWERPSSRWGKERWEKNHYHCFANWLRAKGNWHLLQQYLNKKFTTFDMAITWTFPAFKNKRDDHFCWKTNIPSKDCDSGIIQAKQLRVSGFSKSTFGRMQRTCLSFFPSSGNVLSLWAQPMLDNLTTDSNYTIFRISACDMLTTHLWTNWHHYIHTTCLW